jgi:hypothetical protein
MATPAIERSARNSTGTIASIRVFPALSAFGESIVKLSLVTLAFLLTLATAAQAHYIWIEQPAAGQAAVIRFGEFGENLRETSPGLLDNFGKPTATLITDKGEQAAEAVKSATGFMLPFRAGQGQAIVAQDAAFPLRKFKMDGKDVTSWFHPGARFVTALAAQPPKLTLDVVPVGRPGAFKVFFKGQPLPKAKVTVIVQSGWTKEARTDEQGQVSFGLPWKGSYVLEVGHIDRTPGERTGAGGPERYDGINYVTTLHVTQDEGVEPIPAGPAASPARPR